MRNKKRSQNWWKSLSSEQQANYLSKIVTNKAEKRRAKSIKLMKKKKPVDCKKCIHGVTQSCTDDLPRGCEYFYKVA